MTLLFTCLISMEMTTEGCLRVITLNYIHFIHWFYFNAFYLFMFTSLFKQNMIYITFLAKLFRYLP